MTDTPEQPPNCQTCDMIGCKDHGFHSQYPDECQHFSQKKGCLFHTGARAYLMRDVVKELERQFDVENNRTARVAIALIKGDGK